MKRHICSILVFTALLTTSVSRTFGEDSITNSLGMEMVLVQPGSFTMGSDQGNWDERPVHEVIISKSFLMGVSEVTNAQFEQFEIYPTPLRSP